MTRKFLDLLFFDDLIKLARTYMIYYVGGQPTRRRVISDIMAATCSMEE